MTHLGPPFSLSMQLPGSTYLSVIGPDDKPSGTHVLVQIFETLFLSVRSLNKTLEIQNIRMI